MVVTFAIWALVVVIAIAADYMVKQMVAAGVLTDFFANAVKQICTGYAAVAAVSFTVPSLGDLYFLARANLRATKEAHHEKN